MPREPEPKRVLVVEDDEDSAELLAETFQHRGHQVEIAHDGRSALELAVRFRPHVAVLDVGLPDMDGYDLARRLRGLGEIAADVRLIALTGYGGAEAKRRSHEAGFDVCLVKPAHPESLMQAIEGSGSDARVGS